jgi:hypothetical protein
MRESAGRGDGIDLVVLFEALQSAAVARSDTAAIFGGNVQIFADGRTCASTAAPP